MAFFEKNFISLLLLHIFIGLIIYFIPPFAKIYGLSIILVGFIYVLKTQNKNNEVLLVAAYIVGSEALLRMTDGNISYEFSKYGVMIFLMMGMYYSGFSKNAVPFWLYLLLLTPGVIIATYVLNLDTNIRTTIAFNISGPVCLAVSSIYTYNRKITLNHLNNVLLFVGLPVVSMVVYLLLYTPDLKDVLVGTGSNYETSGGFGPNQVATLLGLGMFIFFSRILLLSKSKLFFICNLLVALYMTYRGLITFSRGGMVTGFIMMSVLIAYLYFNSNSKGRFRLNYMFVFVVILLFLTWSFTSSQTGGLIDKRYSNQDAKGREKESQLSGREEIIQNEFANFIDNPIFGIGVAKGLEIRREQTGRDVVSHNEVTRTLAEHGALGIIALLIVFFTPIFLYLDNKQNIYIFCFLIFWILTINHAAMRLAAPAFIYSLSLLKVTLIEENIIHRE